jgi:hypothetical protein
MKITIIRKMQPAHLIKIKLNEGFYIAQYLRQSRLKALGYIQMYRERPCRASNLDRQRANLPL